MKKKKNSENKKQATYGTRGCSEMGDLKHNWSVNGNIGIKSFKMSYLGLEGRGEEEKRKNNELMLNLDSLKSVFLKGKGRNRGKPSREHELLN